MTALVITPEIRERLRLLRELAHSRPVEITELLAYIATPEGKAEHMRRMTEQTIEVPMAFLVTLSVETGHPCGKALHMSMSVAREGRVPNAFAIWMVAEELGFRGSLENDCAVWAEALQGHGMAVNVVQPFIP